MVGVPIMFFLFPGTFSFSLIYFLLRTCFIYSLLSFMETIQSLLQVNTKKGSERTDVVRQIFEVYQSDRTGRKIENWKRFCLFCREKKIKNTSDTRKAFKKTSLFIRESTPRNLAVKLSHIPTQDLYYILSVSKDRLSRHESVGGFIFGSIKQNRPIAETTV